MEPSSAPDTGEQSPNAQQPVLLQDNPDETFVPGALAAFDYSAEPFADVTDDQKKKLGELVLIASRTDVASRRFEVEQAWEARLFERGYQHLLPRRGGGWSLPGEGTQWGPLSTADSSALFSTNTYGRDKDIIVAAISRETPKVTFFPNDAMVIADVLAAEQANKYKDVYAKNNDLRTRLAEMSYYYWTDGRCVLYTRDVADAQRYGTADTGESNMKEVTTVYGKLEAKVPMNAQTQREMHFLQLYSEIDIMTARAKYPWVAKKIRPGSCGIGEIELDKIARVNTKLALLGSYVTGDAMMREVTEQYTWLRPEAFYDETVSDTDREAFLQMFPKGCLIVFVGTTFAFCRNESMDDHVTVSHATPGIGQNRRALGTNSISVQKRLNTYLDIMDDFFRRTIPRRIYHADAFDVAALKVQDNIAGGSVPYQPQPGMTADQLVFVEPTPQPQPALPDFCNMFFETFPASLSGAVPSLFGGDTNTDTVGGIAIQRDQALARIGIPWTAAHAAICEAAHQAVICAATRTQAISETLPTGEAVQIDPDQLKGNIVCYPEYDASFPESWSERETRYTELVSNAPLNPFYAELLKSPSNMRAIADNIRMAALKVPGEDSVKKQMMEIEQLKVTPPNPNPQFVQAQDQLNGIVAGKTADEMAGAPIPSGADQMLQQVQQAVSAIPPEVTSIPVANDASENHAIEALTCFEWMNGEEGIKFKYGTAQQKQGFENVLLHWQAHTDMAKKLAPSPEAPPPHVSIPFDKIPPNAQAEALGKAGLHSSAAEMAQNKKIATQHKIAEKVVPKTVPSSESITVNRMKRANPGPPNAQ